MLKLVLLLVIFVIQCHSLSLELENEWQMFKTNYNKSYESKLEEATRKTIFAENKRLIEEHNKQAKAGLKSFFLGVNKFADMTSKEFASIYNGYRKINKSSQGLKFSKNMKSPLPHDVDWRKKGYVTPVKNQGGCGSCWAFSATGSLEGQHFAKTGKLVSLSEQQLVDCSTKFGNSGCDGGDMDNSFKYIKSAGGIDTEESYPYLAKERKCAFKPGNIGATDEGFVDLPSGDEEALQKAIAEIGPISVGIDASQPSFQLYANGIYYEPSCSSEDLDHGVLVVGYGSDKGSYYIVKNSWSEEWGNNGYILMSRNRNNNCGIATDASYPIV